jgi:hypothetical protein
MGNMQTLHRLVTAGSVITASPGFIVTVDGRTGRGDSYREALEDALREVEQEAA